MRHPFNVERFTLVIQHILTGLPVETAQLLAFSASSAEENAFQLQDVISLHVQDAVS